MATQKKTLLSAQNVTKKAGAANDSDTGKRSSTRNLSAARGSTRKALRQAMSTNHNLTVR